MNHGVDELAGPLARIAELRAAADRPGRTEVSLAAAVGSRGDVERLAEAGVDRVLVRPWRRSDEAIDSMRRFADEVMAG